MSDPIRSAAAPATDRTATRAPSVGMDTDETTGDGGAPPVFAPPSQPGEIGKLGPYRILKQLGHGGMGAVYLGLDERLGRKLALKVMLPQFAANPAAKERFLREARAAAQITHDNVVTVYEADERDGVPFIAMQFLQGYALDEFLKKKGPPTMGQILRIARETAAGLAAAHNIGLVHRDIKPGNLWLEAPNGRIKVLDFGLARPVDSEAELTKSGAIIGTPTYMSPEQGRGQKVDGRTDLFSLGAVLYRLCTGKTPFEGANVMAILTALSVDEPTPVRELNPEVPGPLAELIHQLLAKQTTDRPQTAEEVVKRVRRMMEKPAVHNAPTDPPATTQPEVVHVPMPITAVHESAFADLALAGEEELTPVAHASGSPRKPRSRWLIGSAFALLAACLVVGVIIIKITNKDGTTSTHTIEVPDGAKADITKDGKPLAVVTPKPAIPSEGPPTFKNSIGMEFVKVPKGTAWLGGGGGKPGETQVVFEQDFYLGKYEVTQEEWEKVTGENPSNFSRNGGCKDAVKGIKGEDLKRFPVEWVSWDHCQSFIERLNKKEKDTGWVYRLPTAQEWEYACRGGPVDKLDSAFDFYLDRPWNAILVGQANFLSEAGKGLLRTCKVGSYVPNSLGLFDMHGNIEEWCEDMVPPGPNEPNGAPHRVVRGGLFNRDSGICRAAYSFAHAPSGRSFNLGLRLARVPVSKDNAKVDPNPNVPGTYTNGIGMKFVPVPKGTAWLGGGGGKPGETRVEIPADFYLGKYEVTQEEWEKVTGVNPSEFKRGNYKVKDIPDAYLKRFPVEIVSWEDCQVFIERLNKKEKDTGWVYRLPTEAEWEYACRGGPVDKKDSAFDFYFAKPTNTVLPDQANFAHAEGKGLQRTSKVGSYLPNVLGLYDMHGNAWEWCDYTVKEDDGASFRVRRGGCCYADSGGCRAVSRHAHSPSSRHGDLGLRVVRVPVGN